MRLFLYFPLLLISSFVLLLSCGSSSQSELGESEETTLYIVDKGLISFPLDEETAVDYNSRFKVNKFEGREYLSFANRPTSKIYEFDYETGEPTRKIELQQEGPNQVRLFFGIGMFFHYKDSIFIDSGGLGYYLINGKGEVISKFGMPKDNTFNSGCCPIVFNEASFYTDDKVFGLQRFSTRDEEDIAHYTFGNIGISDQSKTKKILKLSAFEPDYKGIIAMEQAKDPWVQSFYVSFYHWENLLYAASPISDTVHVFKDFEWVEKFYVGHPQIALTDYKSFLLTNQVQEIENGYQNLSQTDQPPHFADVFLSPDGNMIYRILIEGTKGKEVETLEYKIPEVSKASLVVFDKPTGELITFDLPVDELEIPLNNQSRSVFVSNAGIHFQTKEQENEDRLDFRVFGVKK